MKSIMIILLMALTISINATDPLPAVGDRLYVVAESGINARVYPSLNHQIIFGIGYGELVKVLESDTNSSECIDDRTGHWIRIAHGNQVGYVFDGYLSKLPPVEFDGLDTAADYMDKLKNYALMQIGSTMPKVTYNNMLNGEGAFKIDIHNLKQGCQFVEYHYWEGMDCELQLSDLRPNEIQYLLKEIFNENPNFDETELPSLEDGKTIQFATEDTFYVTIRKLNNKYSIFLEVGSCC